MVWSWRDLRVFLFLFVFSLLIWTTRLLGPGFDPYRPAPLPVIRNELPADAEPQPAFTVADTAPRRENMRPPAPAGDLDPHPAPASPARLEAVTSAESPTETANRPEQFYRLVIPVLAVDSEVLPVQFDGETWDVSGLGQEVGLLETQESQDENRNLTIAGHFSLFGPKPGPFRYLSRLVPGAQVYLYSDRFLYIFEVQDSQVISGTDLSVLAASDETRLTLLTCETWDEKTKRFLRRRAVQASLAQIIPVYLSGLE